MAAVEKNLRVRFFRSHDTQHALTGTVVEVQGDEVLIRTDPDGVLNWAPLADMQIIEDSGKGTDDDGDEKEEATLESPEESGTE